MSSIDLKRTLALLLSAAAVSSLFACSQQGAGNAPAETSAAQPGGETVSETAAVTEDPLADRLPDKKFGGKKFRVVTSDEYAFQIFAEEEVGEVTKDAIFRRNRDVMERFDMEMVSVLNTANKFSWYPPIVQTVLAGDDAYELVGHYAYNASVAIAGGIYKNWLDMPHVDLERPWWNQNINEAATFNGKCFALTGYLATTVMQSTYAIFVNEKLAGNYGHTTAELYGLVSDGKWTIDRFSAMIKGMYSDLDGDGKRGIGDRFGYGSMPDNSIDFWLAAFDQPIAAKTADGKIKIEIMTDKTVSALGKLLKLYYENDGAINYETVTKYVSNYGHDRFAAGLTVFAPSFFSAAYDMYRDMDSDYGILPIPKWDDAQTDYYTHIMDKYTAWGAPVTVKDDEFVGIVTEALCAESLRSVYPVFYDVALKTKYSSDPETAAMVDLVMEGATFDLAYMFGDYCGKVQTMIREHVKTNDPDFASDYAKRVFKLDELYGMYK